MSDAVFAQQAAMSVPVAVPLLSRRCHSSSGQVHIGQSNTYGDIGANKKCC